MQKDIQRNGPDNLITKEQKAEVIEIMKRSGSEATLKGIQFIKGPCYYYYDKKLLFGLIPGTGFYIAGKAKNHVRLIEICVTKSQQGKGYGDMLLNDLIKRAKEEGLHKITLRTSRKENAVYFWQKKGATLKGINGDDYEMELFI